MCLSYTYNTFPFLVSKNPSFKIYKLKSWKVHCIVLTNYCRKYSDFVIIKMYKCHNCHQFDDELMMTHKLWHPPLYKLLLNWYWQYWSCVYLVSVWHQNCSIAHHYFADLPWQLNKHLLWCTRTNRKLTGGFFFFFPLLCLFEFDFGKTACEKKFVIFFCVWEEVRTRKRGTLFFSDHQSDSIKSISLLGQYFPVIQTASKCYPRLDFFFYLNFIVWTLAKAQLRTQQRRVMPAHTESCRLIH